MSVKLIYGDVAVGAAEDAAVTTSSKTPFSTSALVPFGGDTKAIATMEPNGWGLIKDYSVLNGQDVAFWSMDKSGADCSFDDPPFIQLDFDQQYTATGLSVHFAAESMDFAAEMTIEWYQGATLKERGTYYPTSAVFTPENVVEAFDKIVLTFNKTNLPYRRIKVNKVVIGIIREFDDKDIKSMSYLSEISLISETLPENVLDAAFHSDTEAEFIFQKKQPVHAYNGAELIGVYYIEQGRRTGATSYEINCEDMIGVLENELQNGGIWFTDTALTTILAEIFGDADMFDIDPALGDATLRGFLDIGTKRDALQQIAFALGAIVDTSGSDKIRIFPPPAGTGAEIPATKTYADGSMEIDEKVTEVTVTAYVFFDERPGENQEYVDFNGQQYRYYTETMHARNPDMVSTDFENVLKFDKSYLVNLSNAQTLADNIMTYYQRQKTYNFRHVEDGQQPADRAQMYLPWADAPVNGNIVKMSVTCSGIMASESVAILD